MPAKECRELQSSDDFRSRKNTSDQSDLQPTNSVMSTKELQVPEYEVPEALLKIDHSKSAGPDEIPERLLREGAVWLSVPLTKLFNLSPSKGSLPSGC